MYVNNNVLATQLLLEAAQGHPEKRFIFASSSSIYGNAETLPTPEDVRPEPYSPYGVTKLASENLCQAYHANWDVQTVVLRYFSVYGPRQRPDMAFHRFCAAALRGEPITVFGDGEQRRDFTYVDDVVAATRAAVDAPDAVGRTYNVGGGSRTSVNQTLEMIAELAGRELDVTYIAAEHGDVRETGADTARAERDLGFRPRMTLAAGLEEQFRSAVAAEGRARA
jgi:UDP-glucose 4-epimerase